MKSISNYTTKQKHSKSIAKIQEMLASVGANSIMVQYDHARLPSAISFEIEEGKFVIEANRGGVNKKMQQDKIKTNDIHACNVAWKIIQDYVEAQCAMIEAKQLSPVKALFSHLQDIDVKKIVLISDNPQKNLLT